MGDFNSRVSEKDDFCLVDEHLRTEFGLLEVESYELANRFAQRNISLKRFNSDKKSGDRILSSNKSFDIKWKDWR